MRENLSQSIEDYLKAVYELTSRGARATTTELARVLGVTPASVTGMIKKLSATEPALVEYRRHRGVVLTAAGEQVALETIRHHRLLELFLHQILDYPWDEVHDEADRLEHVISEKFERAIASALGNPEHDPHGHPIPGYDLSLPEASDTLLSELRPPQRGVVTRVRDADPDLLRYLRDLGVTPEAEVRARSYSEFDGNLELELTGGKRAVLGPRITAQIHIQLHG
jgi:DtxR family Mn-dependent transcriptional regulator